jgi:hypothetical protein
VSLQWPENDPSGTPPRRARAPTREPLDASLEVFETTDEDGGNRQRIPVLILIAVLFVIGALLFVTGPLPSVFPHVDCGGCLPALRP